MVAEPRRAAAAFELLDATGRVRQAGGGEAGIGDDALSVGAVTVSWLDADRLTAGDYRLELHLWPEGRLVLRQLVGVSTVLEMLAGPSAATYVFRDEIEAVNRDLQLLHFRRAPLALSEEQAAITTDNPHRLALRRLEPLRRLRSAIVARIVHNERWASATQDTLKLASARVLA